MNGYRILTALCLVLLLVSGAQALRIVGGGDTSVISEPTDDDIIASSGTLIVDAPIGSLIAAGGAVHVNAPVAGDVIAVGGTVQVNGTVGGRVASGPGFAPGTVDLDMSPQENVRSLASAKAVAISLAASVKLAATATFTAPACAAVARSAELVAARMVQRMNCLPFISIQIYR